MHISACTIAKNEEKNIAAWLSGMKQIANEIIIIDTGSKDNTKKIGLAAGAKIYDFTWCDDFAAAKNYAIKKANGDWILFFDVDEYFTAEMAISIRKTLEELISKYKPDAFMCKLINIDKDDNNQYLSDFYQIRIFRRTKNIYYKGKIHEELIKDKNNLQIVKLPPNIYAYHTGYSSSVIKQKHQRNLRLLQKKIALNGEQNEDYPYLTTCYLGLGDYEKAIYYAQKFIASGVDMLGTEIYTYLQCIDAMIYMQYNNVGIQNIIDKGISRFPQSPDFMYRKALLLLEQRQYAPAEKYLNKALYLYEQFKAMQVSRLQKDLFNIYGKLAQIAVLKNDKLKAVKCFVKSLQANKYSQEFLTDFYNLQQDKDAKVKIKLLRKIYNKTPVDRQFLLQNLAIQEDNKVYSYYAGQAEIVNNKGKIHIQNRKEKLDGLYKEIMVYYLKRKNSIPKDLRKILPRAYGIAFDNAYKKIQ